MTQHVPPVPHSDTDENALFQAIANFTYDWETWVGLNGRPRWVNPAVERITGYSAAECLAMADYPLPLVHEQSRAMIAHCLRRAGEGHSGNDVEFMILRKDEQSRWGAVSWQTITDEAGLVLGYRTSVRDITERKQAEETMRTAQREAEHANQTKSRFLAAASHDLRQPIQAIGMFASALRNAPSGSEREDMISAIQDSVLATDDLLNALLDVSRLDAGVMKPQHRAFAIADILERAEAEFLPRAQANALELHVITSSAIVRSDQVLVGRIIRNLLSNAIRYTKQGRIVMGCRRAGNDLRVEIWDTGIGIANEDLSTIFEEFHQLDNPERDRDRGLGLGLAIVRRVSRLLSHRIDVRSSVGKGSVFSIALPLTTDKITTPGPTAHDDTDISGALVLYVDDDNTQLNAMRAVLGQWGCEICTVSSPDEAVQCVQEMQRLPDAIITDYRLRGNATGAEAIAMVRAATRTNIPAAILTGDTEPKRIAEAAKSGIRVLHKPLAPIFLKQAIAVMLESSAPDSGARNTD